MATITSSLGEDELKTAGTALQQTLVDLIDLSLVAKQAHWTLTGKRFRSVHLQLDEVVTSARLHSDTVAERAAALGFAPDGRAATVAKESAVPDHPEGYVKDDAVVAFFVDALGAVIARLRENVGATEEADPVTQDLLIAVTADLEKHHWMFEAERS
jgi:starvation-inducible DNA-binding protein